MQVTTPIGPPSLLPTLLLSFLLLQLRVIEPPATAATEVGGHKRPSWVLPSINRTFGVCLFELTALSGEHDNTDNNTDPHRALPPLPDEIDRFCKCGNLHWPLESGDALLTVDLSHHSDCSSLGQSSWTPPAPAPARPARPATATRRAHNQQRTRTSTSTNINSTRRPSS